MHRQRSLRNSILSAVFLLVWATGYSQGWQSDTSSFYSWDFAGSFFEINFVSDGPMGRDWIIGNYLDKDSLTRCVAYREGGRWKPLPFHGYYGNYVNDIEMYGDTLYIGGSFGDIVMDKDSSTVPNCNLLKWYNDSLWADTLIAMVDDMTTKGDTLLIAGGSYYNPPNIIYYQFLTTDGGSTWQYPYSIVHPTESTADFGPPFKVEVLDNGDILTINNGSPRGNAYSGISRWDGSQWHSYGAGLSGSYSRTFDFQVYQNQIYMGGTFNQYDYPADPGNFIVRWNGLEWTGLANGINGHVNDLFVYDSTLFCRAYAYSPNTQFFGDAYIPYLAGWNGSQWCGTPNHYNRHPQSFGFANDTLFVTFEWPTRINGDTVSFMAYYTGDYLNGPNAICSTPGLREEEMPAASAFELFPNPAGREVSIAGNENIHALKLYDMAGRCVLQQEFSRTSEKVKLDISPLRVGIYLLEVNGSAQRKLVKE